MLRCVLQGYIDGVKSGRELGRRVKIDISYIYLCGGDVPNFRTFNRFYKNFFDVIICSLVVLIKAAGKTDLVPVRENYSNTQIDNILKKAHEIVLKSEGMFEDAGSDFEKYCMSVYQYACEFLKKNIE